MNDRYQNAIDLFLERVRQDYAVADAYLFGSVVRGTQHGDSDLDVAVILENNTERYLEIKLHMGRIAFDVMLATDIDIDPIPIHERHWNGQESYPNKQLLETIRYEGVTA